MPDATSVPRLVSRSPHLSRPVCRVPRPPTSPLSRPPLLFPFGQGGNLPLHVAAENQASAEVVRALLDAYPEAAKEMTGGGFEVGRSASVWSCDMLCVWSHVSSCASSRVCVLMCVRACCSLSVRASVSVGGCEHAHNHSKVSVYRGLLHHWFVCVAARACVHECDVRVCLCVIVRSLSTQLLSVFLSHLYLRAFSRSPHPSHPACDASFSVRPRPLSRLSPRIPLPLWAGCEAAAPPRRLESGAC